MKQMQCYRGFGWFVGLGIDDPEWVSTAFTKNRNWLLTIEMSHKMLAARAAR